MQIGENENSLKPGTMPFPASAGRIFSVNGWVTLPTFKPGIAMKIPIFPDPPLGVSYNHLGCLYTAGGKSLAA